jgi:hypothetical protein
VNQSRRRTDSTVARLLGGRQTRSATNVEQLPQVCTNSTLMAFQATATLRRHRHLA